MKIKRSELIQLANKYIGNDSLEAQNQIMLKIATARCARISYETLGDNPKIDYEADLRLHDMLLKSGHFSPFEHVARAMSDEEYKHYYQTTKIKYNDKEDVIKSDNGWCRNFKGFISYRSLVD